MKLLALSAEIPSLENLYMYSSFYSRDEMLLYNLCRVPTFESVVISPPRHFQPNFVQVFESIFIT